VAKETLEARELHIELSGAVRPSRWQRRLAALLEVVGVFVIGTLLARLASRGLDLGPANLRALEPGVEPDFVRLSWSAGVNLLLRYGLVLGLAFAVGWWHRRRHLSEYGVTTAGRSPREHVGIAVLLFAVVGILPMLLKLLPEFLPMGRAPQHWALIESVRSPGMWLYLFVGSFGLVPIAEELLARGYIQSRLAEDFGPSAAILITAVFFTFSHTQYFISSLIGVGMLVSLFIASVAGGYVRHRTGSLLPVIIAHALGNLPFRGWLEPTILGVMVLLVALRGRVIYGYAVRLWQEVMVRDAVLAAVAGVLVLAAVLAQVLLAPILLPVSATIALGAALALEFREKRST
jgi:membrane protease YdiL (CAAX protease family)